MTTEDFSPGEVESGGLLNKSYSMPVLSQEKGQKRPMQGEGS